MLCDICGTDVAGGEKTCPACGHVLKSGAREGGRAKEKEGERARPRGAAPLLDELDPEMEEAGGPEAGLDAGLDLEEEEEPEPARPARKDAGVSVPVFTLDPAGLRKLLAKQPDIVEPGLSIYAEKGRPVGAGYSSAVGVIDLLARDKSGGLVVVKVGERGQGEELVAATLQRIGWVRKHLGKGKEKVRGIILVEQAPENLSYTASAMAGTITFKTYRVAVTFEDVEI